LTKKRELLKKWDKILIGERDIYLAAFWPEVPECQVDGKIPQLAQAETCQPSVHLNTANY
jgi:hypothetical protein